MEPKQTIVLPMESQTPSYQPGLIDRANVSLFKFINKHIPWHKLPPIIGALNLEALRIELRQKNLHDGYATGAAQGTAESVPIEDERHKNARHSDGKFNSLELPLMGCSGMRFGRSFARQFTPKPTEEELWNPNPRMLSELFMKRKEFIPATTLNLLAAAWIQFQTHDWFHHDTDPTKVYDVPLPEGDTWPHGKMTIQHSLPDKPTHPSDEKCPGYRNTNTPWWDGSQIYGSSETETQALRDNCKDGKLFLETKNGEQFLPRENGNVKTGFSDNWWVGLEILHTLFALEHNSICDVLHKAHPDMKSDELFDKARLVNCALMAKIHTVEWTPGILGHPTLQLGMNANWWGLAGEFLTKNLGRLSKTSEVISGIPGSGADQFGCPYSLTEEFVSVYRMHSLIPDNIAFFNAKSGEYKSRIPVKDTLFSKSQDVIDGEDGLNFSDVFYSFGINFPGAITNHNYPDFLRDLQTPDNVPARDMGTLDLLRDRERGVPRYNNFRRGLHMTPFKTFEELTGGDKELAQQLSDAYNGNIELVDTLVGSHSEVLPKGFGFSDTAFRVFILMASRRLKSDRFIATQWNAETYTKEGLYYVQHTTMKDILERHFPQLKPMLKGQKNVFAPWTKLPGSKAYDGIETNAPKKK